MAEGVLRAAAGDLFDVRSAGSDPAGHVHPKAVEGMHDIGIDISAHRSKHMNEFMTDDIQIVITVCGKADQLCPTFPGTGRRYHWGFVDPAKATGSDSEIASVFRRVRDEIKLVFEAFAVGYREALAAGADRS